MFHYAFLLQPELIQLAASQLASNIQGSGFPERKGRNTIKKQILFKVKSTTKILPCKKTYRRLKNIYVQGPITGPTSLRKERLSTLLTRLWQSREVGHGGVLTKKAGRTRTCVFKGLVGSRLRLGFPKKALLPHKQPEQVARNSKGYEVLSKKINS